MRMQANPSEHGYHRLEHEEDPTCHKTNDADTTYCRAVEQSNPLTMLMEDSHNGKYVDSRSVEGI